jgi:3-(3-hydroxy-phenyl)propionate hydroxylase
MSGNLGAYNDKSDRMNERRSHRQFPYRRSPDQDRRDAHHPVVIVGAGPVGLCAAIDLAQRGVPVVLLDDADRIGEGSRGICYAKRTLEILDRLGVAQRCLDKGVTWKVGKVFQRDALLYRFDLLPEDGHEMPAFINLQQYYIEQFLCERAQELDNLDIRWRNKVSGIEPRNDGARLTVETPDGPYRLDADWVIAADGARSTLRRLLSLDFVGEVFEDRFLIADVKMAEKFPPERWFWFDPPFHAGRSALLHKQPDNVWRIDLQLGPDADPAEEQRAERVIPRLRQMLGPDQEFDLEWVSVYTFQCRRLERFVHGRVVFVGDAAHQVSPFGARGANSGIQDAENLAWKLALALRGEAPLGLIDTYDLERSAAADENIGHSTRSTDFIAPRSAQELRFRDAALALARHADFAKRMVNSGRLSAASVYDTPLSTPDGDAWAGTARLGAPLPDAPLLDREGRPVWLLDAVGGNVTLICVADGETPPIPGLKRLVVGQDLLDCDGHFTHRFDATPGATYLVRPDQHLAARWRRFDASAVATAVGHFKGLGAGR